MPDFREFLEKRNAATSLADTYETKHERSMALLNQQLKPQISALRLLGPAKPQMREPHRSMARERDAIGRCQFCDPPPKVYKCPKCDAETTRQYEMTVHNILDTELCNQRADKKARRWSQHA